MWKIHDWNKDCYKAVYKVEIIGLRFRSDKSMEKVYFLLNKVATYKRVLAL